MWSDIRVRIRWHDASGYKLCGVRMDVTMQVYANRYIGDCCDTDASRVAGDGSQL